MPTKMIAIKTRSYLAIFSHEEDGAYFVSVPSLSGCFSQGDNFEEARRNVDEATQLYLRDSR